MPWSTLATRSAGEAILASDQNITANNFAELAPFFSAWTTFTPTLTATTTNPNLGSTGTTQGAWIRIGKAVIWWGAWAASGTGITAGSGEYRIALPAAAKRTDTRQVVATGYASNGSTTYFSASLDVNPSASSARVIVVGETAIASPMGSGAVSVASGWVLSVMGIYEAS